MSSMTGLKYTFNLKIKRHPALDMNKLLKRVSFDCALDAKKAIRPKQVTSRGRMLKLSPKTIRDKRRLGTSRAPYPAMALYRTGGMEKQINYWQMSHNRWAFGFKKGTRGARLAEIHIAKGASRSRVKRPFLWISKARRRANAKSIRRYIKWVMGRAKIKQIKATYTVG